MDAYITGDFCIGNGEKVNAEELELAPFVERLWRSELFLTNNDTPMSLSTLRKLADKEWRKHEEVKHYTKHKNKPDDKKGRNKK